MIKKFLLASSIILVFSYVIYNKINLINSEVVEKDLDYIEEKRDSIGINDYLLVKKLYDNGQHSKALSESLSLLDYSKSENNNKLTFLLYDLIGDIFKQNRSYEKSLSYYNKAFKTYNNITDKRLDSKITESIIKQIDTGFVSLLFKLGSVQHNLKSNDSAKYYYNKIIQLKTINKQSLLIKAKAYNNLSNLYYYTEDKNFKKAEEYALTAIKIKKEIGDKASEAASIASLANVYLEQNKYEKAKKFYLEAISLIEKNKDAKSLKFKEVFYENISWAMYNQKNYNAYNYLDKSFNLRDSLREAEIKDILLKIENKHKENLEQQKINLIKNQAELIEKRKRTTNYLFGAITLLTLVISGIVLYNYKLRQKNLQLKLTQSKLIEKQNIDRIKSESQVKILNATIDGKESERKQIAETLHDSVSALLSSANMHLSATKKQFNGSTPIELDKTQEIILEAAEKVRDLSHTLVSSILLKFGLEYALKDIAKKYSNTELSFHTEFTNVSRYSQEFEIKIYNVIHELINNILKHSKASNAYIVIEDKNDFLSILIEDDGIGFNYKYSNEKTGLGLNQIEARIQMMNGNFLIESSENRGAKITISVPVQKKIAFNYA